MENQGIASEGEKKSSIDAIEYVPYENPGQQQAGILPGDTVWFYARNERTGETFELGTSVAESVTPRGGYERVRVAFPTGRQPIAIGD